MRLVLPAAIILTHLLRCTEIDGVAWDFHDQVAVGDSHPAAQPRLWGKPPRPVEKIILEVASRLQRLKPRAHDHVAGGAGTGFLASVLDRNTMFEQGIAEQFARWRFELRTLGT